MGHNTDAGGFCMDRFVFLRASIRFRHSLSASWRIVSLLDMRIFDKHEKRKLSRVRKDRDKKYLVTGCDHGNAVVSSIPNRIHGMRGHVEYPIEREFLINEIEEITPIPRKIFDYPVSIKLDPKVNQH